MKVCYFGNPNSVHLRAFSDHFSSIGEEVHTFGMITLDTDTNHIHHDLNAIRNIRKSKRSSGPSTGKPKLKKKKSRMKRLNRIKNKLIRRIELFEIKRLVRGIDPDIVHGHDVAEWGILTTSFPRVPSILTVWGSDVFRYPKRSKKVFDDVKHSLMNSDVVHVTNQNTKDYIVKEFGVKSSKIIVLPWGIDLDIFNEVQRRSNPVIRKRYKISEKDIIILYPKGFRDPEMQNYIRLLEAFAKVSRKHDNLKLIMISYGNNVGMENLDRIIKENALDDRVFIETEFLDYHEMADIYRVSDLSFIIEDTDELSQAIFESMACGAMPVLSDIDAYRDLFIEDMNCKYISQKKEEAYIEAIEDYLKMDEIELRSMKKNNIRMVKEGYDLKVQMLKIEDLYKSLYK